MEAAWEISFTFCVQRLTFSCPNGSAANGYGLMLDDMVIFGLLQQLHQLQMSRPQQLTSADHAQSVLVAKISTNRRHQDVQLSTIRYGRVLKNAPLRAVTALRSHNRTQNS